MRSSALVCLLAVTACGGPELPPRLPSTEAHERAAARVELVTLVISDRGRAEKVRALYIRMEALMRETQRKHANELAELDRRLPEGSEGALERSIAAVGEAEVGAIERYALLQLEIRRLTTAEEFARLDAIK